MIMPYLRSVIGSYGKKRLPVFEMSQITLSKKRLPNSPSWKSLAHSSEDLIFTGIQLVHAVVKADFLDYRDPTYPGLGFVLQSHYIVDWAAPSLHLQDGGSTLLTDFARTSMAGRLGQGLALLFAHTQGYFFNAHLRALLETLNVKITNDRERLLPIADFVCDGNDNDRSIVEAKASFAYLKNDPSKVKQVLKNALEKQVHPWMDRITPIAHKSFVISSYLREKPSSQVDPSCLVFVDPEDSNEEGAIDVPKASVRLGNYAAWLGAMGLIEESHRLRSRERAEGSVTFAVFKIDGRDIAFPWWNCCPIWLLPSKCEPQIMVTGIAVDALEAVSSAAKGDDKPLLEYRGAAQAQPEEKENDLEGKYSLFPDGTFFGTNTCIDKMQYLHTVEVRL